MENWHPYALAVASTAIGWLLGLLSSWWSIRGQRHRVKRRMLFYLLELEYLIARMDVGEAVDVLIDVVKRKFGDHFTQKDETETRQMVRPLLAHMIIDQSADDLDELEEGYLQAVEELSYIAPFIAFRLKGRTRLFQRFEVVRELITKIPTIDASFSGQQVELLSDFFDTLKPDLIAEDLETVRGELVSLSKGIGPGAYFSVRRRIRRPSSFTDDDQQQFENFMQRYIEMLALKVPGALPPGMSSAKSIQ